MLKIVLLFNMVFWAAGVSAQKDSKLSTSLTRDEEVALKSSIEAFYQNPAPYVMSSRIPKFNVGAGQWRKHRSILDSNLDLPDSLRETAGRKLDRSYLKARADWARKRFKSKLDTLGWANRESGDKVDDLVNTWISEGELVSSLDGLPVSGQISGGYWSGDYWRMNWGLTSYRYSTGIQHKFFKNAVEAYFQPEEWLQFVESLTFRNLAKEIKTWSPSEKYDLQVGDNSFGLTREQKSEGASVVKSDGKVEDWFGICDGWAPASVFVPPPKSAVKTMGLNGVEITWLPDDVRAVVSLAWANGNYESNFVGRRCESSDPKLYRNGRLADGNCFDTNPATFHLALGNLIGNKGIPFVIDASFDSEVWNQPVLSYEFKYFNPLKRRQTSRDWREVMVPYDGAFKTHDRFQSPLTRGLRKQSTYSDRGVKAIVGVQATVVYLVEYDADFNNQPQENVTERVTYVYDLELHEQDGQLVPLGGEWHNNTHPDFLWLPQKGAIAREKWDDALSTADIVIEPQGKLTEVAKKASKQGYPLCSVVEALVTASSGNSSYRCQP